MNRRNFVKTGAIASMTGASLAMGCEKNNDQESRNGNEGIRPEDREFNGVYSGLYNERVAFPLGGIGAGMVCLEGNGCLSHVSVRNTPDIFNEPMVFGAISVKGTEHGAKVLEGPVPPYKIFGRPGTGNGAAVTTYGFPRFQQAVFKTKYPFGEVELSDGDIPLDIRITGWSPFIPGDADHSSLPVAALEYRFVNNSGKKHACVFSYHAYNFMRIEIPSEFGGQYKGGDSIQLMNGGFVLSQSCLPKNPHYQGDFAIYSTDPKVVVDGSFFRGGWFDSRTIVWKDIEQGNIPGDQVKKNSQGASLYVPFEIGPGEEKTIPVLFAWYVPHSNVRRGSGPDDKNVEEFMKDCNGEDGCCPESFTSLFYEPWYAGRFGGISEVASFWSDRFDDLRKRSMAFSRAFYEQTLPPEVIEAVAANLTILKSPTVLRQKDGKLWAWEGCHDLGGCCHGSCTHVWNYAQSIPHLFPGLERSLRETEFTENQGENGHQTFRANLPIRSNEHGFHAAADGQLGGIMKVHREWRISGNTAWLEKLWPKVKNSMDYCIGSWDPERKGRVEEPHHNTYDIEFWGPDGMCMSFYLGALFAMVKMGNALNKNIIEYERLFEKGKAYLEEELYDGEYFYQKITWEGLKAASPLKQAREAWNVDYSEEALELLNREGPKYQYGKGCLSDGILGVWIGRMCGLEDFIDTRKVRNHLLSVYRYNHKKDLSDHVNPQRPSYAYGHEGGLLLCSWPKGGKLSLPFVYSNEVWTGIEYQVAAHLMMTGDVDKGLEIVRYLRRRYDGRIRNPFNEYECGHWYARAMASYGMIQGLTGLRYDKLDRILYIESKIGDNFKGFISTEDGYGLAGLDNGVPFIRIIDGSIDIKKCFVSGKEETVVVKS